MWKVDFGIKIAIVRVIDELRQQVQCELPNLFHLARQRSRDIFQDLIDVRSQSAVPRPDGTGLRAPFDLRQVVCNSLDSFGIDLIFQIQVR